MIEKGGWSNNFIDLVNAEFLIFIRDHISTRRRPCLGFLFCFFKVFFRFYRNGGVRLIVMDFMQWCFYSRLVFVDTEREKRRNWLNCSYFLFYSSPIY